MSFVLSSTTSVLSTEKMPAPSPRLVQVERAACTAACAARRPRPRAASKT
ncbi:MAG: hypothetical protein U0599_06535 [Vicinamibacteria bacterium]